MVNDAPFYVIFRLADGCYGYRSDRILFGWVGLARLTQWIQIEENNGKAFWSFYISFALNFDQTLEFTIYLLG